MSEKSYHVENKQLFKKTIEVKLYNKILNLEDQQMEGSCEYKRLVKTLSITKKSTLKSLNDLIGV